MTGPTTVPEPPEQSPAVSAEQRGQPKLGQTCDRCGAKMLELSCKIVCLNCGNRFDCSDLNLYFD